MRRARVAKQKRRRREPRSANRAHLARAAGIQARARLPFHAHRERDGRLPKPVPFARRTPPSVTVFGDHENAVQCSAKNVFYRERHRQGGLACRNHEHSIEGAQIEPGLRDLEHLIRQAQMTANGVLCIGRSESGIQYMASVAVEYSATSDDLFQKMGSCRMRPTISGISSVSTSTR